MQDCHIVGDMLSHMDGHPLVDIGNTAKYGKIPKNHFEFSDNLNE